MRFLRLRVSIYIYLKGRVKRAKVNIFKDCACKRMFGYGGIGAGFLFLKMIKKVLKVVPLLLFSLCKVLQASMRTVR